MGGNASDALGAAVVSGIASAFVCYLIYDLNSHRLKSKSSRIGFIVGILLSWGYVFNLTGELVAKPIVGLNIDTNKVATAIMMLIVVPVIIFAITIIYNKIFVLRLKSTREDRPSGNAREVENNPGFSKDLDSTGRANNQAAESFDEKFYEQVAIEVETDAIDRGLWTKILVKNGGDESKTKIEYMKERVRRLTAASTEKEKFEKVGNKQN